MWLNGKAIEPGTSYSVTVNSFLASGGDNFRVLAQGANKRDTGKVDLQAMVDYMAERREDGCRSRWTTSSARWESRGRPTRRASTASVRTSSSALSSLAMTGVGGRQGRQCSTSRSATRRSTPTPVDNTARHRPSSTRPARAPCREAQGQDAHGQAGADLHRSHHRHDVLAADRGAQGQGRPQGPHEARAASSRARPAPGSRSRPRPSASPRSRARSRSRSTARSTS